MRAPAKWSYAQGAVALAATALLSAGAFAAVSHLEAPARTPAETPALMLAETPVSAPVKTPAAAPRGSWTSPEPGTPGFFALTAPETPLDRHEFYFTRAVYSSYGGRGWGRGGRGSWAVDYPEADRHFAEVIERVVGLDVYDYENAVSLADPELRRFPILYALEVGRMALTEEEIHGLRDYLNAGGFLIIDDFWGTREWEVFEYNIRLVLPGREIVEVPEDHPIFRIFYEITEVLQVPNVRQGYYGGPTWEKDGYDPYVLGIFDDHGRLMVVINWNTDLGDAWEWSDDPFYPMKYSTFAYEMGANFIVYGMSH